VKYRKTLAQCVAHEPQWASQLGKAVAQTVFHPQANNVDQINFMIAGMVSTLEAIAPA
jgi:hypothetical protein